MSKLRLFQVLCGLVAFLGLVIALTGEMAGVVMMLIGVIGIILARVMRFIWRD